MDIRFVIGSDSDLNKIKPGIEKAVQELKKPKITVYSASAHRVPELLKKIFQENERVIISGAGLSNALTGKIVAEHSAINTINIGVPISDSTTGGISAFLATAELPPQYPALTVGVDNSQSAVNLASKILENKYKKILVYLCGPCEDAKEKMTAKLDLLQLPYELVTEINDKDGLYLVLFTPHKTKMIETLDLFISAGKGIQVCVSCKATGDYETYVDTFEGLTSTGTVRFKGLENAAQICAQILDRKESLDIIFEQMKKKKESYTGKGMIISSDSPES